MIRKTKYTVLIVGSRSFGNNLPVENTPEAIETSLKKNEKDYKLLCDNVFRIITESCDYLDWCELDIEIVSGGAKGADTLARIFAEKHSVEPWNFKFKQFDANWNKYGKAAGPIRNEEMIKYTALNKNGIVISFWDGKSPGTEHTWLLSEKFENLNRHLIKL